MVRELEGEVGVHYIIYNYVQYLQYKLFNVMHTPSMH